MGGVPTKHGTSGKKGRRRSQKKLERLSIIACSDCKAPTLPHRVCSACGFFPQSKTKKESRAGAVS